MQKWILGLALGLLLISSGLVQAQSPFALLQNSRMSYDEIVKQAQPYFDALRAANNGQVTHDEKVFARWASFWAPRVCSSSATRSSFQAFYEYYARFLQGEFDVCTQNLPTSPWRSIGPKSMATMTMGIANTVVRDPIDPLTIYAGCNFSGVWKTTDGGQHWRCITDAIRLPFLPVHVIALDPLDHRIVYFGTGETAHNNLFYGNGMWKSSNGGGTWTHIGPKPIAYTGANRASINVIRFHPNYANNHVILAAGGTGIYRSTNSGGSWTQVFGAAGQDSLRGGGSFMDMEINIANPNFMLAGTRFDITFIPPSSVAGELLLSTNAGLTWRCVSLPGSGFHMAERFSIDVTTRFPGRFYVAYDHFSDSSRTKVVYSTSVGNTLQFQPMVSVKSLTNYHMGSFEVSDSDPNYAYIGGRALGRVNLVSGKRELVYGFEFFPRGINEHPDVRDMVIRPSSVPGKDELLVACDGGIAQSDNSSLSWRSLNGQGLTTNQYFGFDFKPENGHIVAGAMDNYTHYFDGNAWTLRYQGDGGWTEIDDHNSDMVYFVSNDRWLVNRRGMANDSDLQMDSLVNTGDGSGFKLEIHTTPDPVRPNVFWAGDISFLKTVTVVGGPPWPWSAPIFTHPASNGSHRLQDLAISIDDHKTMYWSYTGPKYLNENSPSQVINLLFRSRDGGQTYTDLTQNLKLEDGVTPVHGFFFVKDLEIDPEDANHVFAGISGYDWDTLRDQARHKVYETTDGGDHWVDISKGLSPFSVSHLCYQNGSGGVVYAATDAGVFRFDPIRRIWECFNRDLPPASCTKVMVDYCRNRLLVSTYGRGMWEADLPATPDYHITSSRTWDAGTVRFFAGNVIVDPGVVLTVKGSVNFNPGKRLVVDRGAKLLLQGGTLTCACGMWAGVDVYGTFNRFQSLLPNGLPSFQGIVEVVGGTIENAITGISTSLHDSQGNYYWSSFGGIVRCSNARFLNNKRDVEMLSYVHPNMSYFRNCLFETNRALRDGLKPTTHVSMWNVRKIPFTGCSFRHADTTGYPVLQRGNGITAVDATYMVDWRCTSSSQNGCTGGVPSTFEGLNYGVHHESNNPLLSPAIRHAAFVRNTVVGAKLRGAHFAVIEDNSFDVGTTLNASGLYLDRCTKYSLQGNAFDATRPSNQARFGFVVRESGDDYNFAYNNSFSNLPYALAALEDNEGPSSVDGLIMNCNDFTNCTFGIMALGTSANSGVGESQGRAVVNPLAVPTNLVRNRYFGACSAANENKFLVSHPNQYRIDHRCNSDSVCQPLPQPACSDIALDVTIASVILVRPSHCQRIGGASLPVIEPNITASTKRLVEQQAILSAKVDGGNTADRLAALAKSTKASAIKADLLRYSPYLSDTVLVTMLRKQPLLPAGTLQTLLLANSPLSPKVLARLPAANLPQTVQKKIAAAQKGVSQRELLENDMFTARNDKTFWEDEKIRFLLRDSLDPRSEDNLVATLTQLNYARCYQQQARAMQTDFATSDASSTNGLQNCKGGSGDLEQLVRQLDVQAKECFGAEERFPDITHEKAYPVMPKSFALAQGFLEKLMELRTPESYLLPPTVAGTGVATAVTDPTRFKLYQNADANQLLLDFDAAIGAQFRVKVLDLQGKSLLDSVVLPNTINTLRLAKHKAGQYRYELLRDGLAWKSGQIQLN